MKVTGLTTPHRLYAYFLRGSPLNEWLLFVFRNIRLQIIIFYGSLLQYFISINSICICQDINILHTHSYTKYVSRKLLRTTGLTYKETLDSAISVFLRKDIEVRPEQKHSHLVTSLAINKEEFISCCRWNYILPNACACQLMTGSHVLFYERFTEEHGQQTNQSIITVPALFNHFFF